MSRQAALKAWDTRRKKALDATRRKKPLDSTRRKTPPKIAGTKEWSVGTVNLKKPGGARCKNNCRYCYAAQSSLVRFKTIKTRNEWGKDYDKGWEPSVNANKKFEGGMVMFPSSHDIFPENIDPCIETIRRLARAGNKILIVSKPLFPCIKQIIQQLSMHKDQILFRFTIGSMNDELLRYWEPNAPTFAERLACLKCAHECGWQTSVSVEPMLDAPNVIQLFHAMKDLVTDGIWIGKMNKVEKRVKVETGDDRIQVQRIQDSQTDEKIKAIYEALKDEPKIRWKESVKEIVGLELPQQVGLDK